MVKTVKFKIAKLDTKEYELQVYRPFGNESDVDNWVMVDRFNSLTGLELKELADYIYHLIENAKH